jgi:hypothetical protein
MTDRPRSAAASLYPNLPHDDGREAVWVKQQRGAGSDVAGAVYPHLRPPPPPKPAPNPYRGPEVSLAQQCDENPWLEQGLALCGLIRKR